jgi:hypothetical protein
MMNDTVDQIASNLVREGIDKHKARELAVHFIGLVGQVEPEGTINYANPKNWKEFKNDTWSDIVSDGKLAPRNEYDTAPPEYPQTLSIADVDHANIQKPDTWTIEHFECWQREQVARENVRVLRRHIKELRQAMSPNPKNDDTKSECVADVDEIAIILAKEGLDPHRSIDVATHIAGMFERVEKQKTEAWTPKELELMNEMIEQVKELERQACEIISREWAGLTEEDIYQLRQQGAHSVSDKEFRAIEAKLREKNT